jgi:hypothetical protein
VKIDKDGRVLSVSGLEDLEQQIGQSIEMTQGLQQQFQALLPSQEVDIGSSWTTEQSQEIPDFGEMKFQTKYTLAGFERVKGYDCARIDLNMTGSVIGKGTGGAGAAEEMAGLPFEDMSMDLSGNLSGDGVVYFAPDEGKLIGTYIDMDIDFRLKMDLKMDTSAMQESMEGMEGMEDMFKGMMQDSFEMDLKLKMKMAVNMELL